MSLHRLDESATVECPNLISTPHGPIYQQCLPDCSLCSGTGRIPGEPDVEIIYHMKGSENDGWYVRRINGPYIGDGPQSTEAAALQAAQEANHGTK